MSRITLLLRALFFLVPSMSFIWWKNWEEWVDEHRFLGLIAMILAVYMFYRGLVTVIVFIQTFFGNWQIPVYDSTPLRNIDSLKAYREAKLGAMSVEEAARLLNATRALDLKDYDPNSNTGEAMRFMNAKLGALSNEDGIEYLKGAKK